MQDQPFSIVRAAFHKELGDGRQHTCPCCNQSAKIYRRKLTKEMVGGLTRLYALAEGELDRWFHINEVRGAHSSGDYAKLRFWGLIAPKTKRTKSENANGFWGLTPLGCEFVRREVDVPLHTYVYNNAAREQDFTRWVAIDDVLENFSYAELMKEHDPCAAPPT